MTARSIPRYPVVFLVFCLGGAATFWTAGGACRAEEFRFARAILMPAIQEEVAPAFLVLPPDVYSATRDDFADLRILDSQGREIPRWIRRAESQKKVATRRYATLHPGAAVRLTPQPEGSLEIVVTVPEKHPPVEGLRIHTPLKNFQQSVRVDTSEDGRAWEPLVEDAALFDYSQWMEVRHLEIAFPRPASRHLRLQISKPSVEHEAEWRSIMLRLRQGRETQRSEETRISRQPFRLERIESWHQVLELDKQEPLLRTTEPLEMSSEVDRSRKVSVVRLTTGRRPLVGLIFETQDRNFRRAVKLEVPDPKTVGVNWRTIAEGTVTRLELPGYHAEDVTVHFPQHRADVYRLTIQNGDNEPLRLDAVRGIESVYQAWFLVESPGKRPYRLCYGDDFASPPDYDTAAVEAALSRNLKGVEAHLGPAEPLAYPSNPLGRLARQVGTAGILIVIVLLLAAGMGWSLYRAAKHAPQASDE